MLIVVFWQLNVRKERNYVSWTLNVQYTRSTIRVIWIKGKYHFSMNISISQVYSNSWSEHKRYHDRRACILNFQNYWIDVLKLKNSTS